jgi:hypothetical protein
VQYDLPTELKRALERSRDPATQRDARSQGNKAAGKVINLRGSVNIQSTFSQHSVNIQ